MNLYEIDLEILSCVDAETGEILDFERLESLTMERDRKIENVALWVKNLMSDAGAIKAEKDALAEREAKCRAKAESLKRYLADALQGQKFSTAKCAVSFRKASAVQVDDVDRIPAELLRVTTTIEPNKTAIKAAIKEGCDVSGCQLIETMSVQIK